MGWPVLPEFVRIWQLLHFSNKIISQKGNRNPPFVFLFLFSKNWNLILTKWFWAPNFLFIHVLHELASFCIAWLMFCAIVYTQNPYLQQFTLRILIYIICSILYIYIHVLHELASFGNAWLMFCATVHIQNSYLYKLFCYINIYIFV